MAEVQAHHNQQGGAVNSIRINKIAPAMGLFFCSVEIGRAKLIARIGRILISH